MEKPQKHFKDVTDNSANPFIPKITRKPYGDNPLGISFFFFNHHDYHVIVLSLIII